MNQKKRKNIPNQNKCLIFCVQWSGYSFYAYIIIDHKCTSNQPPVWMAWVIFLNIAIQNNEKMDIFLAINQKLYYNVETWPLSMLRWTHIRTIQWKFDSHFAFVCYSIDFIYYFHKKFPSLFSFNPNKFRKLKNNNKSSALKCWEWKIEKQDWFVLFYNRFE